MRVISGVCRGKRLFTLKGLALRPTSDRVKEAIFDILQDRFQGQRVLDLFAGTGALGIEALSRGAGFAVFVESHGASRRVIQRNLEGCRLENRAEIIALEARAAIRFLEHRKECFDLIFMDPPYRKGFGPRLLADLAQSSVRTPQTLIVAEHSGHEALEPTPPLVRIDQRKYGGTRVSFFCQRDG